MATKTQKARKASGAAEKSKQKLNNKLATATPAPEPAIPRDGFTHREASDDTIVTLNIADVLSNSQNPRESAPFLTAMGYGIFHRLDGSDKGALVPLGLSEKPEDKQEYIKLLAKEEGVVSLAKNMRVIGMRQAVQVRPITNGYDLIFGCRRLLAALYNHCDVWDGKGEDFGATVKALIVNETDERARLISLSENIHRLNMNPMEQARIFSAMRSAGFAVQEIADNTEIDHQVVRQRLALLKLPPADQAKVEDGELGVVKALKLVKDSGTGKNGTGKGASPTGKGHTGDGSRRKAPSISDLQTMYEEMEPTEVYTEQVRKWIALELIQVEYMNYKQLQKEKDKAKEAQAKAAARNGEAA